MQSPAWRFVSPLICMTILTLCPVASAQFQNPITAAKDAWKKAQEQQRQGQQQQQATTNGSQNQPRVFSPQPINPAGEVIPDSECCTATAMQNFAKQASFLDIVGIKLGMTPEQAFAAIRAFNPKMRINIVKTELDVPGDPDGQDRIPHYATAQAENTGASGGSDVIIIQFTTPPNPPVVARISRGVVFPNGQPVLTSTLLDGLRKKYGQDNNSMGGSPVWLYGPDGKLLQRQLNNRERICSSVQPGPTTAGYVPVSAIVLDTVAKENGYAVNGEPEITPACIPFTAATATNINFSSPNAQNGGLSVGIESPALLYASYRSTQEWLQAKAEEVQQKQHNAAEQRTAPKF